jgi:hypothetical protein
MRILLSLAALACFSGAVAAAEDNPAKADNATCFCGQAAGDKTVTVKAADGRANSYKVCCGGCAKKVEGMKPDDAIKAFADRNKPTK